MAMIPYGRQWIGDEDVAAVAGALRSDWLTQGPEVGRFEEEFAEMLGGGVEAVAVSNATAALHLAMRVAGIGPGDRIVTSPITFLASANAGAYVGATVDFCDIDPVTRTLDPAVLEREWKPDTKAVVAVDYAGQAADLPEIARVARERGAVVIEDACHGTGGGFFVGEGAGSLWKLGASPWSDAAAFSFHPVKTMTSAEGGMFVTGRRDWAEQARRLRSHGVTRDAEEFTGEGLLEEKGPWYYEMQDLGYNYRLTDLQSALGRSQLRKLEEFMRRRREIVATYNEAFRKVEGVVTPGMRREEDAAETSWHLYTLEIDFGRTGLTRSEFMARLREGGVGSQVLYIPVHLQPWYRRTYGYGEGKCPVAEAFYKRALSLPLYAAMSDADVARVISVVKENL